MKAKKDGTAKKSTKGIPRVTAKVLEGGEALAKYQAAVAKLDAATQKECAERLVKAQTEGPKVKKVNFSTIFTGRSVEELTEAQTALNSALESAAIEGIKVQEMLIEKASRELAALKAAAKAKVS